MAVALHPPTGSTMSSVPPIGSPPPPSPFATISPTFQSNMDTSGFSGLNQLEDLTGGGGETSGTGFTNTTSPVTGGFPNSADLTTSSNVALTIGQIASTLAGAGTGGVPGLLGVLGALHAADVPGFRSIDMTVNPNFSGDLADSGLNSGALAGLTGMQHAVEAGVDPESAFRGLTGGVPGGGTPMGGLPAPGQTGVVGFGAGVPAGQIGTTPEGLSFSISNPQGGTLTSLNPNLTPAQLQIAFDTMRQNIPHNLNPPRGTDPDSSDPNNAPPASDPESGAGPQGVGLGTPGAGGVGPGATGQTGETGAGPTGVGQGTPGAGGPGSGDGTGTVVCSELHRQGLLNGELWRADQAAGVLIERTDPNLYYGYRTFGVPLARRMAQSATVTKLVAPLALAFASKMAGQSTTLGTIILAAAPVVRTLGWLRRVYEDRVAFSVGRWLVHRV